MPGGNPGYRTTYGGTFGTRGFFLLNRRLNWWHGVDVFTGDTQTPPDQWHHIAITYAGDTGSFTGYVDGVDVGDSLAPGTSLPTPAFIGGDDVGEDLVGLVDELSTYDRVLSQNDIQRVFMADSFGKCLVFNGHFETGELSRWTSNVP